MNPILFRGLALVGDTSNILKLKILTASSTAYSFNPFVPIENVFLFYYINKIFIFF